MSHICPCGCKQDIPTDKLLCSRGWFRVPKSLRDRVWQTYRLRNMGPKQKRAHLDACQIALDNLKPY